MSDSHSDVLKLVAGFSDSVLSLQRETDSLRKLRSELSRDSTDSGNTHAGTKISIQNKVVYMGRVTSCGSTDTPVWLMVSLLPQLSDPGTAVTS